MIGVLGTGAFATVVLAHDPSLDGDVAIKLLADQHARDPGVRRRFVDEARLLRQLGSDRIVAVHDIGEHAGQPYLVMEHLSGGTLEERLQSREAVGRPPSRPDIEQLVRQLADGLAVVHDAELVHRDIKPSNLLIRLGDLPPDGELLAPDEALVIGDFGLARRTDSSRLTVGGGTDGYMAPEQRHVSATVDQRADIHAAGAVIGRAAFGPNWHRVLVADPTTGATALEPAGAEPLAFELRRAMSPRPADRHGSIDEWADAVLASFDDSLTPTSGAPRRRGVQFAAAALVVLSLLAAFGVVSGVGDGEDETPDTVPTRLVVGEPDGPDIVGPDEILLGDQADFTHTQQRAAEYRWEAPDGAIVVGNTISYVPLEPGDFQVTLIETVGDEVRESTRVVRVRNR